MIGVLEVVLHNSGGDEVVLSFLQYAAKHGAKPVVAKRRDVNGLTFIPVRVASSRVSELARFSFVRVARGMPTLRPFRPAVTRSVVDFAIVLPIDGPVDTVTRAAIFDGGIPEAAQAALSKWVNVIEPSGIGPLVPILAEHGLGVTGAFLFGALTQGQPMGIPFCGVDHIRVLDDTSGRDSLDYFDVLDRIVGHLHSNLGKYSLVNISLGPAMAVDDDEVTLWTAALDKRFAHGGSVATVAAGNDGQLDAAARLNRIQPPADGVNVLSVGAADRTGTEWQRASYSCVGPGRSPGLMKPDGLAFGGSDDEMFGILTPKMRATQRSGTSLAAPLALRAGAAVVAQLGQRLTPLAVRALLIHRAQASKEHDRKEVGWGRFETDPLRLITCEDDEALVVFQGELPVGEHLRAPIPIPEGELAGKIVVSATMVIAPEVDPEHPTAYTRSGLEVAFRPHSGKHNVDEKGKTSTHPKTRAFFSSGVFGSESAMREDGHKWEPCLRNELTLLASSLSSPCFDVYYHHRESGMKATSPQPIPYAFVIGVKAAKVPDLYNRVVRAYAQILQPIQPQQRIPIRT